MSELSIVIRTRNCREELRECLAALDRQTCRDAERLVVDSGSSDGTPEIAARGGCRVFSVPPESFAYGTTLNHGFRKANGTYLCSLSAHCVLMEPTVLERLFDALRTADEQVAGVYGCPVFSDDRALAPPGDEPIDRITRDLFSASCNRGLSNSFSIIRRGLWEAVPFVPERCEDQKWAAHHLERGFATLCVRSARYRYRINRSWDYYVRKHRDDFLMLHRTWPEAAWPRLELLDSARNRYRVWAIVQRLRQAGWRWESLSDIQKWHATHELGLFWAAAMIRGGRWWGAACAADLARAFLLPKRLKGWRLPEGKWP
jgi:glycosyltransferase involved in cell wall biosynthesis